MTDASPAPSSSPFVERRGVLIAMGNVLLLFALFSGFGAVSSLATIAMAMVAQETGSPGFGAPFQRWSLLANLLMAAINLLNVVIFVWLGIGSILCKRWARKITLAGAWLVGAVQALGVLVAAYALAEAVPRFHDAIPDFPSGIFAIGATIGLLIAFVFNVVPAALFAWVYGMESVRLTCQWRDPKPSWTDPVPPLVLAFALLQAYAALYMPAVMVVGLFPYGGVLLSGAPAAGLAGLSVLALLYLTWGLARLQRGAWLLALAFTVAVGVPSAWSVGLVDYGSVLVDSFDQHVLPGIASTMPEAAPGAHYDIDDRAPFHDPRVRDFLHSLSPVIARVGAFLAWTGVLAQLVLLALTARTFFARPLAN